MARSRRRLPPGVYDRTNESTGETVYYTRARDGTGSQRSFTGTLDEVLEFRSELRARRRAVRDGKPLPTPRVYRNLTVAQLGVEWWPGHVQKKNYDPGTSNLQEGLWRRYVLDADLGLGDVRLVDVAHRVSIVEDWIAAAIAKHKAPSAVSRVISTLNMAFNYAVREGWMDRNPMPFVENKPSTEREREVEILDPVGVALLMKALIEHPNKSRHKLLGIRDAVLVSLLAGSGARPEEALVVAFDDVSDEWLRMNKLPNTPRKRHKRKPRIDPITAGDVRLLRGLMTPRPDWALVLPKAKLGGFWTPSDWSTWRDRVFHPACRRVAAEHPNYGFLAEGFRPYDLRHSYITQHLYAGENPVDVADWAGHTGEVMWRVYKQEMKDAFEGERKPVADQIREARKKIDLAPLFDPDLSALQRVSVPKWFPYAPELERLKRYKPAPEAEQ